MGLLAKIFLPQSQYSFLTLVGSIPLFRDWRILANFLLGFSAFRFSMQLTRLLADGIGFAGAIRHITIVQ
jgi:hypothetical protein